MKNVNKPAIRLVTTKNTASTRQPVRTRGQRPLSQRANQQTRNHKEAVSYAMARTG